MITQLPRKGALLATAAFILASVLLTLFAWRTVGGPTPLYPQKYEVQALFENASQLTPNADIRIAGVSIGKVTTVEPRGLKTEATLSIKEEYAPLPKNTRAILRQKTLLGETFVQLTPGSSKAPKLMDGTTLPESQIGATQPLDRILGALDKPTRENLVELLTNTGTVLDERGQDFNDTLGNIAVGTRQLAATVEILDGQRRALGGAIRNTGQVFQTIGDQQAAVAELVRSGNAALSATASQSANLTATIDATPPLLNELRLTSGAVETTAVKAGPTLREFRPVAPLVEPALRAVRDSSPDVTALLDDFDKLLPVARRGLPAASRFTSALTPLMDVLGPAARQVTPVTAYMAQYRKELVATMANVSASTLGKSPATNGKMLPYLRTLLPLGPEALVAYGKRLPTNRHNAYRAPGALADLLGGLTASNCAGTTGACKTDPGWSFDGGPKRYFQHVEAGRTKAEKAKK